MNKNKKERALVILEVSALKDLKDAVCKIDRCWPVGQDTGIAIDLENMIRCDSQISHELSQHAKGLSNWLDDIRKAPDLAVIDLQAVENASLALDILCKRLGTSLEEPEARQ